MPWLRWEHENERKRQARKTAEGDRASRERRRGIAAPVGRRRSGLRAGTHPPASRRAAKGVLHPSGALAARANRAAPAASVYAGLCQLSFHRLRGAAWRSRLARPIIVTVTGEGGSGGALAIAVGDKVNILENSFYSVISPEGCASIIWRDATKAETAAAAMKITAKDLKDLGIVDEIIPEPDGGAHTDHEGAARLLDDVLDRQLVALTNEPVRELLAARYEKFRKMGQFFDLSNG